MTWCAPEGPLAAGGLETWPAELSLDRVKPSVHLQASCNYFLLVARMRRDDPFWWPSHIIHAWRKQLTWQRLSCRTISPIFTESSALGLTCALWPHLKWQSLDSFPTQASLALLLTLSSLHTSLLQTTSKQNMQQQRQEGGQGKMGIRCNETIRDNPLFCRSSFPPFPAALSLRPAWAPAPTPSHACQAESSLTTFRLLLGVPQCRTKEALRVGPAVTIAALKPPGCWSLTHWKAVGNAQIKPLNLNPNDAMMQ